MLRRLLLATCALCLASSPITPALAQDASDFVVRLNRLENQSRQTAGQIETLQHENRQLREQLRKVQEDVEFRLQEAKGVYPLNAVLRHAERFIRLEMSQFEQGATAAA